MPVKHITNETSPNVISYKKLQKVAIKVENTLQLQKNSKLKNEYSKLNNSDDVLEICKKYLKRVHKKTHQLWEKNNFAKNYCINFKDNNKNDITNNSSFTLLQMFSHFKCIETVTALLQEGVNVNETNKSGKVALHYAVIIQNKTQKQIDLSIEITKLLLAKNANIEIKDKYEKNALTYAIECQNSQAAELLTKKHITSDIMNNKQEYSPLIKNSIDQEIEQNYESNDFDDVPLCSDIEEKHLQKDSKNNSQNKQFNMNAAIITSIAVPLILAYASWLPILAIITVTVIAALIVGKLFSPSSILDEVIYNKIDENLLSR